MIDLVDDIDDKENALLEDQAILQAPKDYAQLQATQKNRGLAGVQECPTQVSKTVQRVGHSRKNCRF